MAKEYDCYKMTLYCKDDLIPFYEKCNLQKKGVEMAMYLADLPPAEPTDDITIDESSDKTA
jgi:hypothetical protein